MGADESRVDPNQVPGFNPDVEVLGRKKETTKRKLNNETGSSVNLNNKNIESKEGNVSG